MILCNYMRLKCGDWGEFVVFGGGGDFMLYNMFLVFGYLWIF